MPLDNKVQPATRTSVASGNQTFEDDRTGPWSNGGGRSWLTAQWQALGLSGQFLMVAAIMLICTSLIAGVLQARWIRHNLITFTGEIAAIYIDSLAAPYLDVLAGNRPLSTEEIAHFNAPFTSARVTNRIAALKIWRADGTIVFSNRHDLIGQRLHNPHVTEALKGKIVIDHVQQYDRKGTIVLETGEALSEFYVPIFSTDGSRVIAVGEIYQSLERTQEDFTTIVAGSWAIRTTFLGLSLAILFLIVRHASSMIRTQETELRRRYGHAREIALENRKLRRQAEEAKRNAVKSNEELISRIGSDLHDGPIQLMSLLMLRLGERNEMRTDEAGLPPGHAGIREISEQVLSTLRELSTGLILPEIGALSLEEAIRLAATRHERLTGTAVDINLRDLPAKESEGIKVCLYRVVQEGLQNAFRHAQGRGQTVEAWCDPQQIWLRVSDSGPESSTATDAPGRHRLGVLGLRNRLATLGGELVVERNSSTGTHITATLPRSTRRQGRRRAKEPTVRAPRPTKTSRQEPQAPLLPAARTGPENKTIQRLREERSGHAQSD